MDVRVIQTGPYDISCYKMYAANVIQICIKLLCVYFYNIFSEFYIIVQQKLSGLVAISISIRLFRNIGSIAVCFSIDTDSQCSWAR